MRITIFAGPGFVQGTPIRKWVCSNVRARFANNPVIAI